MPKSNICVIIVTYNGAKWLSKCLSSLNNSTLSSDIIIVDNSSKDETLEIIKSADGVTKLFAQSENLGFGKACNIGLKYAYGEGYEFFFLLNQDAYVETNCLENLIRSFKKANAGILSPIHYNGTRIALDVGFREGIKSKEFIHDFESGQWKKEFYKGSFVNAAAWMLDRRTLYRVGLFHPLFFHYGEDKNYAKRVQYAHLDILIDKKSAILHDRENRGVNLLKDRPEFNFERVCKQILLNPYNPNISLILFVMVVNKIYVITKGWSFPERLKFASKAIKTYRQIREEIRDFGSRKYNPFIQ